MRYYALAADYDGTLAENGHVENRVIGTVALRKLGLSPHEVVAIGNAANDHSFLELSECSVAVGDAEASIRSAASFTTKAGNGDGVVELIDELIANDLASRKPIGAGDAVLLGVDEAGRPVQLSPYGQNILVVGPSSSGKSTFTAGMIERLMDRSYQVCVIDPEGDYASLDGIATVGSRRNPPEIAHVIDILRDPSISLSVNLLGISLQDRPLFAADLFSQILALRVTIGRPHWVVVDEVHHSFPSTWSRIGMLLPQRLGETILIMMRASAVVQQLVRLMDVVVAVGPSPEATLGDAAAVLGVPTPKVPPRSGRSDECMAWFRTEGSEPRRMSTIPSRSNRLRHLRKYADGNLAYRGFFFRGPGGKLNLRAQNLTAFSQLLMGVDDETFLYHLRRGDYEAWLRGVIKDGELAAEVEKLRNSNRPPSEIRHMITDAIDRRYAI